MTPPDTRLKYSFLKSLYRRAFRAASPRSRVAPCALFAIVALAIVAFSTGANLPFTGGSRPTITVDGSTLQSGLLASAMTPTQTLEPAATPVATPVVEEPSAPAAVEPVGPQPPFAVESTAVAIWDANCGSMLYSKNADTPLPPASLTKMMTLLVALESGQHPMNLVRPGISGAELKKATRSSVMGLSPEMTVTYQDLYMGLMLPSGNDAAIALAFASGNYEGFVARMNERAAELGLTNTHFANPHGLDHPLLYSTAYDLLVLERVMLEHPYAAWVVRTPYYETVHKKLGFNNGVKLLTTYPGTIGGKTGFTDDAGHTIAVSVVRGGRRLDMVVLGSPVKFEEPTKLLDWAFYETEPSC
jgi:D-alanyl-D-alanine carboxypeptidase